MKINERTLMNYSTSTTSAIDKEGWLWKRGEVNKSFQKRYFILKGNLLFYFERKGDKEPVGVIILEGCTIELAEEEQEKFAFKIAFHGDGKRTYVLGTESQQTLEEWMKILACASYDYMKLMVMELQQQLSELEEAERLGAAKVTSPTTPPRVPPRSNRINPFATSSGQITTTKSWQNIHDEFGSRILQDRMKWCQKVKTTTTTTVNMKDDTLLVMI